MTTVGIAAVDVLALRVGDVELRLAALARESGSVAGDLAWRARAADRYRGLAEAWTDDLGVVTAAVGALRDDLAALAACLPGAP